MDATAVEIVGGLNLLVLGWLFMWVRGAHKRIDELDKEKVSHSDFNEMKEKLDKIYTAITGIQVEQARWQGFQEAHDSIRPEKS